jgi:hypothetical protein
MVETDGFHRKNFFDAARPFGYPEDELIPPNWFPAAGMREPVFLLHLLIA